MGTGVRSGGTTFQVILSVHWGILKGGGITFSFSLTAKLPSRGPFIIIKGFGFFYIYKFYKCAWSWIQSGFDVVYLWSQHWPWYSFQGPHLRAQFLEIGSMFTRNSALLLFAAPIIASHWLTPSISPKSGPGSRVGSSWSITLLGDWCGGSYFNNSDELESVNVALNEG